MFDRLDEFSIYAIGMVICLLGAANMQKSVDTDYEFMHRLGAVEYRATQLGEAKSSIEREIAGAELKIARDKVIGCLDRNYQRSGPSLQSRTFSRGVVTSTSGSANTPPPNEPPKPSRGNTAVVGGR